MLIRLTQTITVDGDGDVWGFWGYRDQDAAMQSWAVALHHAYVVFLHERFPTAMVEFTLPIVPEAPGLAELTVLLHGIASDPTLVGVTVDALSEALSPVLEGAWASWQVANPENEEE